MVAHKAEEMRIRRKQREITKNAKTPTTYYSLRHSDNSSQLILSGVLGASAKQRRKTSVVARTNRWNSAELDTKT